MGTKIVFGIVVIFLLIGASVMVSAGGAQEGTEAEGKQEVTFLTLDVVNFRGAMEEFITEFEEANPDIDIEPNFSSDLGTQVATGMETGTEPDIMFIWSPALVPYVRQKKLAEVPPEFESKLRDRVFDYSLIPMTNEGKLYGVPYNYYPSFGAIMYNVDLWDEAGIDPTKAEEWDELMALAQKVTKQDASGRITQAGFSAERDADAYFYAWVLQEGGAIFNSDGSAAFNSPAGENALQRYADIYLKWKVDHPEFGLTIDEFKKGTVAATNGMPWFASILDKDTPDLNWDFFLQPKINDSPRYWGFLEVWMHGVSTKAADKEGVWKFLDFLTTPEIAARWSAFSGELSPVKATLQDPRVTESPYLSVFVPLMEYGKAEGIVEWISSDVTEVLREIMPGSVIREQATVNQALEDAEKEVNRITSRLAR